MADEKPDKDLRVRGTMEFEIDFVENEAGQFPFFVKATTDSASMMVAYSLVATRIQRVIDNNEGQTDKKLKHSANEKRKLCMVRDYCQQIANAISAGVYADGMAKRDARIVLPENDIITGG